MTSVIAAIFVLGFLILFHELGHFLVAKQSGVGVVKFSIGFGPKLVGWRVGTTDYVISAIPLGGFVKMIGEDPDEEVSESDRQIAFQTQSLWKRMAIVVAGPGANLLFTFLAFSALFAIYGARIPTDSAKVGGLIEGMPAARAGLQNGDVIAAVNGEPVSRWESLSEAIRASGGKTLTLRIERAGNTMDVEVTPEAKDDKNIFGETMG